MRYCKYETTYHIAVRPIEEFRRIQMKVRLFSWIICLIVVIPSALYAQVTTATIVGTVTDPSGAAVPHAQVTATNTGTTQARSAETNDQGEYRIEFLPVGEYSIEVNAPGFRKVVHKNVVLQVDQSARVDVPLTVGQTSESVEVTAAPPLVNTSDVELGRTVENVEIVDLPIVNRNVYA